MSNARPHCHCFPKACARCFQAMESRRLALPARTVRDDCVRYWKISGGARLLCSRPRLHPAACAPAAGWGACALGTAKVSVSEVVPQSKVDAFCATLPPHPWRAIPRAARLPQGARSCTPRAVAGWPASSSRTARDCRSRGHLPGPSSGPWVRLPCTTKRERKHSTSSARLVVTRLRCRNEPVGSRTVLTAPLAEDPLTLRIRGNRCSAEVVGLVPLTDIVSWFRTTPPER